MSNKRNLRNTRAFKRGPSGNRNPPGSKLRRQISEAREATGRNYLKLVEHSCYGRRSER